MCGVSRPHSADELRDAALEHLDALYGYALALSRDRAAAEDLVQETYLRAVRGAATFEPGSNLKAWLFVIMRNVWLNELRHARSGPRFVSLEDARPGAAPSDPYVEFRSKEACDDVRQAVLRLPDVYREVIVLRDFEELSYQEIASVLGCPAGTVMSRLGRARQRLRLMLVAWRAEAAS